MTAKPTAKPITPAALAKACVEARADERRSIGAAIRAKADWRVGGDSLTMMVANALYAMANEIDPRPKPSRKAARR